MVRGYHGYHHVLDPRAVHYGMPSCSATVVLAFDTPLDVGWPDAPTDTYWASASGLHLGPALIRTHGLQHGIQLDLTPLGVRSLLGVPMAALAGATVHHDDLPLGLDPRLRERVSTADGWAARFALLEEHLLQLASAGAGPTLPPPEVVEAWRLVTASGGRIRTRDLAARVGWSERHLRARFTAEYGVGPKHASRIARFERARRLADAGRPLAEIAVEAGFADQPHLTREFRSLAGSTPVGASEVFRILQDTATAEPAASYA